MSRPANSKKSIFSDILVVIICVLGFLACLALFYNDLNTAFIRLGEKPVAIITFRYNMAQRRFIDRLIWDRLRNESPLYNGDIIRTADMSEATITSVYGDIIDLFSNTLIQIFFDDTECIIELSGGGVNVNTSSDNMVIVSGKNRINAGRGSVLRASAIQGGESSAFNMSVSEGSAFLNGNSIAAGYGVYINEDGVTLPIPQAAVISPHSGARIINTGAGSNINFTWNKINYTQDTITRLEVSSDRNFTRILFYEDTAESRLEAALPSGTWFWRLIPLTATGAVSQEVPYSRIIITNSPSPVLISPRENQEIHYRDNQPAVRFVWTSSPDALSYNLEAADNPSMQNPVIALNIRAGSGRQHSALSSALGQGNWYWRVTPVYSRNSGVGAVSSEVKGFAVIQNSAFTARERNIPDASQRRSQSETQDGIAHRQIFPPDNYVVADSLLPDMRFTWRTDLENIRFQFSSERDFSDLLIDESAFLETYTIRSMPSGVYFWRIIGSEEDIQRETQGRRLTVADSLLPPDLGRAGNYIANQNDFFVISQENQHINFSWNPSAGADYYAFRLYRGDSSSPPIIETTVFGTSISVNMSNYNDGTYTWTVQALSRETASSSRRTGIAGSQAVNVRHLRPVVLVHPFNGMEYAGLDASRNPDTAQWTSQETAVNVSFIIARDINMRDVVYSRANVSQSFVMPRITDGNYFWTIRALTTEGLDISARAPSQFRVLPIPPLPVPQNRLPADGHTIRSEHIRASRSVNFSWNAVQGANGYIFTIFQGTGRGRSVVIQSPVLAETRYTVEDIRQLGRGTFYWQAEAVYVLDGDFIEQRGQLRENRLNVDIPAPRQINTRDSGILYGN